ncbi:MAG: hypothetical protein IK083_07715 [Abditibacteriota bacterium]|nr:hypothetical protein [Abditibacteriota bacterium]
MFTKLFVILLILSFAAGLTAATLQSDVYSVTIDSQGRLSALTNRVTGKSYLHGRAVCPVGVFSIDNPRPRQVPLVCDGVEEAGSSVVCRYSGSGVSVLLTVKSDPARPGIIVWDLQLRNDGDLRITEVQCPCVTGLSIGNRGSDDTLVRPNRYGEKIPDPVRNLFHNEGDVVNGVVYQNWWNAPRLEYGGQAGMFWMDLYDRDSGFYIASEDKELIGGYLDARVEGGRLTLDLGKYLDLKRGGRERLLFATGVHTGDWHWGADVYRAWAESFMASPQVPRWAREMPNWYWYSSIWSMGPLKPAMKAGFDFNNIRSDMYDKALSQGTGVIGLAGLEFMGHDYPLWEPDPLVGGDETIIAAVQNVHRRGGRIVPYINPIYAWEDYPGVPHSDDEQFQTRLQALSPDVRQPLWDYYKDFVAKRYDGGYNNVESHYHGNFPQMCLAAREWQDYVLWWTERYANYYGFDGVQWDQLGAYQNSYCLDRRHHHRVSGCATEGTLELCRRIFSDPEYKAHDDFYVWYEGCSDVYGQYLHAGHAGFDLWMAYGYPELIQYTFGKYFLGGEYNLIDGMDKTGRIRAFRCIENSFLSRYKLGMGQNRDKALKLEKLAPLTNLLKGLYWYTEYLGRDACSAPEGVETGLLSVRRDLCPYVTGGGYLIPVCDLRKDKSSFEVSFRGDAPVTEALWYRAGINPQPVRTEFTRDNGLITVRVPDDEGLNAFSYAHAYCPEDRTICSLGLLVLTEKPARPIYLELPARAAAGEKFTVRTVTCDGRRPLESCSMNAEDADYRDLHPTDAIDGRVILTRKAGKRCWQVKQGDMPYFYVQVMNEAMRRAKHLTFEVEYLDGKGDFDMQYNSEDMFASPAGFGEFFPAYKPTDAQIMSGAGVWKKTRFTVDDCRFSGGMNGDADLRLRAKTGDLYIASVTLIAEEVTTTPVPGVTVLVGNDERTTDLNGELEYVFAPEDPAGAYRVEARTEGRDLLPGQAIIELAGR